VSKRRLVITAVLNGSTQSQAARDYGVSQGWISRLMARYALEGEAAFQARSRRPHRSPNATDPVVVALIVAIRAELQALLDQFRHEYNHDRPHRSLPH
jgi:transposase